MTIIDLDGKKISVEEQLKDLDRTDFEESLYKFTVNAWPHIDSAPFAHGGYALHSQSADQCASALFQVHHRWDDVSCMGLGAA
jgi:hypothetical protein